MTYKLSLPDVLLVFESTNCWRKMLVSCCHVVDKGDERFKKDIHTNRAHNNIERAELSDDVCTGHLNQVQNFARRNGPSTSV